MINPTEVDINSLPKLPLSDRTRLPITKGIYFAIDSQGTVQYIGSATGKSGLYGRWYAKGHHRYSQLESMGGISLAYMEIEAPPKLVVEIEKALSDWFQPPLNDTVRPAEFLPSRKKVSVYIDARLKEESEMLARIESRSLSNLIEYLLEREIERAEKAGEI